MKTTVKLMVAVWAFIWWTSPYPVAGGPRRLTTSTEWRNDEKNTVVVRELNRAYARVPFSQEYEGVLDERPVEMSWTTGPNLPVAWKGGVACVIGNEIALVGGLWMPGYQNLAYAYDIKTQAYKRIPSSPFKTEYTQGGCDGTHLYVISGRVGGRHVAMLSHVSDGRWQWTMLPPLPKSEEKGRWLAVAQVIPGKWLLLCAGIRTGEPMEAQEGRPLPGWRLRLDQPNAAWEPMAPYPGGTRVLLASAAARGELYVFGGKRNDPVMRSIFENLLRDYNLYVVPYNGTPEYRDAYRYSPETNRWHAIRDFPFPMSGGAGVTLQGRYILLMGTSEIKTHRVGKTDLTRALKVVTKKVASGTHDIEPHWTGYDDRIVGYDIEKNNYFAVGVMMYGVATSPWVTDGKKLYSFGGEPYTFFGLNTENVLQIGTIRWLR